MPFYVSNPVLRRLSLSAGLLVSTASCMNGQANTLMPVPAEVYASQGELAITPALTISLNGAHNRTLEDAARRMMDRLQMETGVPITHDPVTGSAALNVTVEDANATLPALGVAESYSLDITNAGVQLKSKTIFGAMHGFETLLQLVKPEGMGFVLPAVHIDDAPRFAWRGLMIDSGRHFMPKDVILRTLDGMAAVKLNVLHWHLSEDQGFRVESLKYPKLQGMGSNGQFYTQQQVREVVQYAAARGIRVVPEFDIPGHATSWLVGYPELASKDGPYAVQTTFGIHDAALDPTRESTYAFLDGFFTEMAGLFPDEFLHIGGDESNGKEWNGNPKIAAFMQQHNLKDSKALQAYFNLRVEAILKKHHRQMIGWDEVLHPDLPSGVVIHNWHGPEFVGNSVRQGHRVIYSQAFYLDHMTSSGDLYAADPLPPSLNLTPEEQKLVLGGEACMWSEHVTGFTIDSRIWPRMAAIAERMWSPASMRDIDDMYRRLAVESLRLDALGLTHISGPQRGLRMMAGSEHGAEELAVLTSALQPVNFSERSHQQKTTALTPMDSLIDFTVPDPLSARRFALLVAAYLQSKDAATKEELAKIFHRWIDTGPSLDALAVDHPLVARVQVRREQLPQMGLLGLAALGYVDGKQAAPADWVHAQKALLAEAAKHTELVDFAVLKPLGSLVDAAAKP